MTLPRILVPGVVRNLKARLRSDATRLGDDDAMRPCAPAVTTPKVNKEYYAARAAACRGYHIGSLQGLTHTVCRFRSLCYPKR